MSRNSVRRWSATFATLALAVTGLAAPAAPASAAPAPAAVACEVDFTSSIWTGGYVGNARIRNVGDIPWNSVLVEFTLPDNHQLTSIWNYNVQVFGQHVRAERAIGAPPVPPGGSIDLGFVVRYTGTALPPSNWRVNGVACSAPGRSPAVLVDPATRTVPEGSSASFTVRLSHPPTQSVQVQMTINGTGVWASPPMVITFSPTDWSTPKSYLLYSTQDADSFDDVAVLTLTVPGYRPATVTFTQVDDD
ncbi:cellulose binding domain-containing protein [Plantactinospora sp. B6F1]|uniref:cellulose binding domain-containing protein n=1 Tax=Plantactinospora sp. B6F1 TaxID=3158971 RepID=UPI0032D93B8F